MMFLVQSNQQRLCPVLHEFYNKNNLYASPNFLWASNYMKEGADYSNQHLMKIHGKLGAALLHFRPRSDNIELEDAVALGKRIT